jgi:hypothetical protein
MSELADGADARGRAEPVEDARHGHPVVRAVCPGGLGHVDEVVRGERLDLPDVPEDIVEALILLVEKEIGLEDVGNHANVALVHVGDVEVVPKQARPRLPDQANIDERLAQHRRPLLLRLEQTASGFVIRRVEAPAGIERCAQPDTLAPKPGAISQPAAERPGKAVRAFIAVPLEVVAADLQIQAGIAPERAHNSRFGHHRHR